MSTATVDPVEARPGPSGDPSTDRSTLPVDPPWAAGNRAGRCLHGGPRRISRLAPGQPDRPYTEFDLAPLGPLLGAEIVGVRVGAELEPQVVAELHRALLEWKVLFFRDQDITAEDQLGFARHWGRDQTQGIVAGTGGGEVATYLKDANTGGLENAWHADMTGRAEPAMGFVLRLLEGPAEGGDTLFADAGAAYDNLDAQVREAIDGLDAVHDMTSAMAGLVDAAQIAALRRQYPPVVHPVVRRHPETGRRTLFVNSVFTDFVVGLPAAEGEQLLQLLFTELTQPEFQVRFRWQPGSVAFWDNRAVQHYASSDYFPQRRLTQRVAIAGDRPYR